MLAFGVLSLPLQARSSCARRFFCRPKAHLDCAAIRFTALSKGQAPTASQIAALQKFVAATTSAPPVGGALLSQTVPSEMARAALQFLDNFANRCDGLNNGTVQPLMADASTRASLVTLLQTSAQLALGVNNTLANYATNYADPLAKRLAALWGEAAGYRY